MVIKVRKSQDRGHFNYGRLETFHTFSFADYPLPAHRRFRTVGVIDEDIVRQEPGISIRTGTGILLFDLK